RSQELNEKRTWCLRFSEFVMPLIRPFVLALLAITFVVICDLTPFERGIVVQIVISSVAISLIGIYLARKFPSVFAALPIIVAALPSAIIGIPPGNSSGPVWVALLVLIIGLVALALWCLGGKNSRKAAIASLLIYLVGCGVVFAMPLYETVEDAFTAF